MKKIFRTILIVLIILIFIIGGIIFLKTIQGLFPRYQKSDLSDIFGDGINEDYTFVIYEDKTLELGYYPKVIDNNIYLPINLVIDYLDSNFFWDKNEKILTYTSSQDVIRIKSDEPIKHSNIFSISLSNGCV